MTLNMFPLKALDDILNDLPEPFVSLPPEQRLELWIDINGAWMSYQRLHRGRNERLPHSLIQRWKRIKSTNEKLRKLLHGLETDMAYEFDRISDHRQLLTPASRQEIREEMPGVSENMGDLFFKSNIVLPSHLAKEAVRKIEDGHHLLESNFG